MYNLLEQIKKIIQVDPADAQEWLGSRMFGCTITLHPSILSSQHGHRRQGTMTCALVLSDLPREALITSSCLSTQGFSVKYWPTVRFLLLAIQRLNSYRQLEQTVIEYFGL